MKDEDESDISDNPFDMRANNLDPRSFKRKSAVRDSMNDDKEQLFKPRGATFSLKNQKLESNKLDWRQQTMRVNKSLMSKDELFNNEMMNMLNGLTPE